MYLLFFLLLISFSSWATITCPQFTCSTTLTTDYCYVHDNLQPTLALKGQSCTSKKICEFDVNNGKFAWYSEATQALSSGTSSFIQAKKSIGQWLDLFSAKVSTNGHGGLLGGRDCSSDSDWFNRSCGSSCGGNGEGEYCNNHADCNANLFCNKETIWPYRARCNDLLGKMEIWTEDYQWGTQYFWWYATSAEQTSGIMRCLEKFSADDDQTFGWSTAPTGITLSNNEYNGLFCKSGLAINTSSNIATCKGVTSIRYNGATLSSPYACTATDTSVKCQLVYGTGASDYYEAVWKWALDGSKGYWGSIIGTTEYKKYTAAMIQVNEGSKCHTLDRNDLRAQSESCGIGTSTDLWRYAVEKRFNVTYWPWIQSTTVLNCINAVFDDSYTNLSKNSAKRISYIGVTILGLIFILLLRNNYELYEL